MKNISILICLITLVSAFFSMTSSGQPEQAQEREKSKKSVPIVKQNKKREIPKKAEENLSDPDFQITCLPVYREKAERNLEFLMKLVERDKEWRSLSPVVLSPVARRRLDGIVGPNSLAEKRSIMTRSIRKFKRKPNQFLRYRYQISNVEVAVGLAHKWRVWPNRVANILYFEDEDSFHFIPRSVYQLLESSESPNFSEKDFVWSVNKEEGYAFQSYAIVTKSYLRRFDAIQKDYLMVSEDFPESSKQELEKRIVTYDLTSY